MTEKELIQALKNNDSEAFKYVYEQYYNKIKHLCYGIVNNPEDAEDLAQEVFIDLYNSISRFRGDSKLSTWIHRIALNKSYTFVQKKKFKDIFTKLEEKLTQHADKVEDEDQKTKQINDLHKAIKALPARQAKAFTLFYYEGIPQKEIVEIMKLESVSTVEQLIFRAKQKIKQTMSLNEDE